MVLPRDALGHEAHDVGLEGVGRQVHDRNPELVLVVVEDRALRDQLQLEEDVPQGGAGATLLFQGAREPLRGEMALLHETLPERLSAPWGHAVPPTL